MQQGELREVSPFAAAVAAVAAVVAGAVLQLLLLLLQGQEVCGVS